MCRSIRWSLTYILTVALAFLPATLWANESETLRLLEEAYEWQQWAAGAIISSLAAAVVVLYKALARSQKQLREEVNQLREDRKDD